MRASSLFCLAATLAPATASAVEWDLTANNRAFQESLPRELVASRLTFSTLTATAAESSIAYQLHVLAQLRGRPIDELGLTIGLDTGLIEIGSRGALIDRTGPLDALERTGLLGATFAELQLGEGGFIQVRAGKLRPRIGDGAIFDAYALGALLDVDLSLRSDALPWSARLWAILPDATFTASGKESPLFDAEVAYHFNRRTEVRFVTAVMIDAGDDTNPILQDAISGGRAREVIRAGEDVVAGLQPSQQARALQRLSDLEETLILTVDEGGRAYDVATRGFVGWSGLTSQVGLGALDVGAVVLFGYGSVNANTGPTGETAATVRDRLAAFPSVAEAVLEAQSSEQRIDLLSYFLGVDTRYWLSDDLSISIFGIAMSGGSVIPSTVSSPSPDDTYRGFVSVAPLLPKTNIFFDASSALSLSQPTLASLAPDGAGLLSGGFGARWAFTDTFRLRAEAAAMASAVTRDAYGVEIDGAIDAFLSDWLVASVDAAVFISADHLRDAAPGYQVIVSARQLFGSR